MMRECFYIKNFSQVLFLLCKEANQQFSLKNSKTSLAKSVKVSKVLVVKMTIMLLDCCQNQIKFCG